MKEFVNLLDVHIACTIKETLNLAKAAKKIEIPRATLVASLLRLERRLGHRIFERRQGSGVVKLTEYGTFILPMFDQLLWIHKNITTYKEFSVDGKNVGEVIIHSTQTLLEGFIIPQLQDFLKENDQLRVNIYQDDDFSSVHQEINDIYIGAWLGNTEHYAYFPFHSFRHKLWASPKYLDKVGRPKSLNDLVNHSILVQKNPNEKDTVVGNDIISRTLAENIDTINILTVAGPRAADIMTEQGLGIMISSEETVSLCGLKVERVLPEFEGDSVDTFVRVRKEFLKTPLAQFIVDWIFQCRDMGLKRIGIRPSFPYNPFKP